MIKFLSRFCRILTFSQQADLPYPKRGDAKRGLATLCIGGGMGVATIFEKC